MNLKLLSTTLGLTMIAGQIFIASASAETVKIESLKLVEETTAPAAVELASMHRGGGHRGGHGHHGHHGHHHGHRGHHGHHHGHRGHHHHGHHHHGHHYHGHHNHGHHYGHYYRSYYWSPSGLQNSVEALPAPQVSL